MDQVKERHSVKTLKLCGLLKYVTSEVLTAFSNNFTCYILRCFVPNEVHIMNNDNDLIRLMIKTTITGY